MPKLGDPAVRFTLVFEAAKRAARKPGIPATIGAGIGAVMYKQGRVVLFEKRAGGEWYVLTDYGFPAKMLGQPYGTLKKALKAVESWNLNGQVDPRSSGIRGIQTSRNR